MAMALSHPPERAEWPRLHMPAAGVNLRKTRASEDYLCPLSSDERVAKRAPSLPRQGKYQKSMDVLSTPRSPSSKYHHHHHPLASLLSLRSTATSSYYVFHLHRRSRTKMPPSCPYPPPPAASGSGIVHASTAKLATRVHFTDHIWLSRSARAMMSSYQTPRTGPTDHQHCKCIAQYTQR
jgi:hypothetical protein